MPDDRREVRDGRLVVSHKKGDLVCVHVFSRGYRNYGEREREIEEEFFLRNTYTVPGRKYVLSLHSSLKSCVWMSGRPEDLLTPYPAADSSAYSLS